MTRRLIRNTTLIWLLALVTAAWGGVVAGHDHFGIDHEHCHVCLLPHVAEVAPDTADTSLAPPCFAPFLLTAYSYRNPIRVGYHSRAPPA